MYYIKHKTIKPKNTKSNKHRTSKKEKNLRPYSLLYPMINHLKTICYGKLC